MSERQGYQVKAKDRDGRIHDERWTADATALPHILAGLRHDELVAEAWAEGPGGERFDPEMLPAQELIRYAEQLIRTEHRVLGDDWKFWGQLADHLNEVAHVPDKSPDFTRPADWREFGRAQAMATGYVRMSARMAGEAAPAADGTETTDA